ncbi:MAG: serine/threonine protein kinase [Planctomycetales bacterium]|nr:serine/threonine protein kinase [Planctomycetales bacterium]
MDNQDSIESDETVRRAPSLTSPKSHSLEPNSQKPASLESRTGDEVTETLVTRSAPVNAVEGEYVPSLEEAKTVIRQAVASGHRKHENTGRTPADIAKVLVGEQLNQYFLEALIGGGGMGAVFRAHDQQLDRVVALKVIPFVGHDPELQRRFRNEAQNAAKLDHPRIARVFDAGNYDDWHYIVFEYINGTNLRDLVDHHGVLSLDDAVVFTSQVAEALDHAAQRGIVHRDIKPSNVLVAEDGSVKLVDMGLARSDNLDLSEDMTASGVTLGTFDYISPEQAFDPRDADLRSDLYSLGCTFYFMVTGEAPYTGGTMLQKLISHGNAPPPNPRQLRQDLPDEAVAVMHRMMAKDPQARYQNARDLLADLNELAYRFHLKRAQTNAVVTLPAGNDGLQRLQNHLPWMIAGVLILMIGGYLELQSTASREGWVINRPPSLKRTAATTSAVFPSIINPPENQPESELIDSDASDTDVNAETPAALNPPALNVDSATMSREERANGTLNQNGLISEQGASVDGPVDLRDAANAAARPPSFGLRLPVPVLPGGDDGASSFQDNGEERLFPIRDGEDLVRSSSEMNVTNGRETAARSIASANSPAAEATDSSGRIQGSSANTPTRPAPIVDLPTPKAVRIVAPSLLALAMRVDQVDRDNDGAILVASLADAIDLAMRFGVGRVELATPELVTGPLVIPQDNMVFESIVRRTTVRMVSPDTLAIGRSEMLNIGNYRTQFRNIDFHWELTQEQVDGGSMFVINDNRLTRFQDCTFTLVNKAIHEGVTFFQIITDPQALPDSETLPGRVLNPNENALPLVAIQFDNAIVRGEATFIQMDYAAALQLVWNNGLLAISGRMIDTFGARRPAVVASPIRVSMSNVTAEIPQGLLRMRLGPSGIYPVPIQREADQCVFLIDEGQAQFELVGMDALASDNDPVVLRGEDNAYVGYESLDDPLLYVSDIKGNTSVDELSELATGDLPWIREISPHWSVLWSSARSRSQTFHRLTPANYRQDGAIVLGFKEAELPALP